MLQLLLFAGLAFVVLMRTGVYPPELPAINLDSDWLYRRAAPVIWDALVNVIAGIRERVWGQVLRLRDDLLGLLRRLHHTPPGLLGEPWPAGVTALWAVVLLALILLLYHV